MLVLAQEKLSSSEAEWSMTESSLLAAEEASFDTPKQS